MTIQESTICSLIQTFPVLLILAQNHNRCVKTPLIYKPPTPTQSPEYYEALDALFQTLYGNDHGHDGHHGYDTQHGHGSHGYDSQPCQHYTIYNNKKPSKPCVQSYPGLGSYGSHSYPSYSGHSYPNPGSHAYPSYSHSYPNSGGHSFSNSGGHSYPNSGGQSYPNYGSYPSQKYPVYGVQGSYSGQAYPSFKKGTMYDSSNVSFGYAAGQGYTVNNKYKVVVKKTRIGKKKRKSGKLLAGQPCTTVEGNVGSCINVYSCQPYLALMQKPPSQAVTRKLRRAQCGFEGIYPKVCCPSQSSQTAAVLPAPPTNITATSRTIPVDGDFMPLPEPPVRGVSNVSVGRVVSGENAKLGQPCTTVEGNVGSCINVYSCQPYLALMQKPPSQAVTRKLRRAQCGFEGIYPKVCCPSQSSQTAAVLPAPPTNITATSRTIPVDGDFMPLPEPPVRGVSNVSVGRVVSGENAKLGQPCTTVEGNVGSCINLLSCQPYLALIQKPPISQADTMMLRRAQCGYEGKNPKVCCPCQSSPTAAVLSTPPTNIIRTSKTIPVDGDFMPLPEPPVCGVSNVSFGRVVNGENAKLGAFPWMAVLGYRRRSATIWLCGGTLVTPRHVLTAAHCLHNHEEDLYLVRLGELDLAREDEGATPVDVLIKKKIKHENYVAKTYSNDIAVLVLDREVQYTALINPICIPSSRKFRSMTFENYQPIIAGWGQIEFNGPSATHLQVLQLPVVSNDYCADAYKQYKDQKFDDSVICAGFANGGQDSCTGDSGGPLMQPIYNAQAQIAPMYAIGVVSYGKECARAGFPGVYSRVTHFVPWIEEKITGARRSEE